MLALVKIKNNKTIIRDCRLEFLCLPNRALDGTLVEKIRIKVIAHDHQWVAYQSVIVNCKRKTKKNIQI